MSGFIVLLVVLLSIVAPAYSQEIDELCNTTKPFDLLFLLDGSGSISGQNFVKQIDFVKDVAQRLEVAPDKARLGVIEWATSAVSYVDLTSRTLAEFDAELCPTGNCSFCMYCEPIYLSTRRPELTCSLSFQDDGECDRGNNHPDCDYDSGDCCDSTCPGCDSLEYPTQCYDPTQPESSTTFGNWANLAQRDQIKNVDGCTASTICPQGSADFLVPGQCPENPDTCCYERDASCSVPQIFGATLPHKGFNLATEQFNLNGRAGVDQFIVFSTDGEFSDREEAERVATQLKANGVYIIGIGVGAGANDTQVARVSSGFSTHVDDFNGLNAVVQQIYEITCAVVNNISLSSSVTPTNSPSASVGSSPSGTPSLTGSPSQTGSVSASLSVDATSSQTSTQTPSQTPSQSSTPSQTPTQTSSQTPSQTPSQSPTSSQTPTQTPTQSPSQTITQTPTQTPTQSQTITQTSSQSQTATSSETPSQSATQSTSPSASLSDGWRSVSPTMTTTPSTTPTSSVSASSSQSVSATVSPSLSVTVSVTVSQSGSAINGSDQNSTNSSDTSPPPAEGGSADNSGTTIGVAVGVSVGVVASAAAAAALFHQKRVKVPDRKSVVQPNQGVDMMLNPMFMKDHYQLQQRLAKAEGDAVDTPSTDPAPAPPTNPLLPFHS